MGTFGGSQVPIKKDELLQVQYDAIVKPLRDNNTVENNGSQLTGGALTSVVMATVRRVNLPNISPTPTKNGHTHPPDI